MQLNFEMFGREFYHKRKTVVIIIYDLNGFTLQKICRETEIRIISEILIIPM